MLGRDATRTSELVVSRPVLSLAVIALVVTGCAGGGGASPLPRASAPASDGGGARSAPAVAAPSIEGIPGDLLATLVADASERTGTSPEDIVPVSGTAVEWSDGSLDCPEPGMGYTQAIVPGFQVTLEAGGIELDYRVGDGEAFVLCVDGRPAPAS
jgi:hypothetical protein